MSYKPTIGLEIHLQLATESKIFCDCPNTSLQEKANSDICPICTGQPGALPFVNKKAIEMGIRLGLVLNGKIENKFYFERKNYFYPDLPKGYQISQKRAPLLRNAELDLDYKKIKIDEIHLEEDTAKIYHQGEEVLIDFNRAGAPLLEIVTAPEIENAREAKQFCEELQAIVRTLGISSANMEKGEMRCEVNISLNGGKRVEIKNLNSFRAVERCIEHETKRQAKVLEEGKTVIQETRGWDDKNNKTIPQRIKEESEDYRYFPEPDLPVFEIISEEIDNLKKTLPELPSEKRKRLMEKYGFDQPTAKILTGQNETLIFIEEVMDGLILKMQELIEDGGEEQNKKIAKKVGDWLINKLFGLETALGGRFFEKIKAADFVDFMFLVLKGGMFSNQLGENILRKMYETGKTVEEILGDDSMRKIDSQDEVKKAVELVLENYPEVIADYKNGKTNALKYLLGQVMAATKGKADPKEIEKLLLKFLEK